MPLLLVCSLRRATGTLAGHFASLRWASFFRSHFTMALYALPMAALNASGNFLEKRVVLSVRTILFDRLNDKCANRNTPPTRNPHGRGERS